MFLWKSPSSSIFFIASNWTNFWFLSEEFVLIFNPKEKEDQDTGHYHR